MIKEKLDNDRKKLKDIFFETKNIYYSTIYMTSTYIQEYMIEEGLKIYIPGIFFQKKVKNLHRMFFFNFL